MLYSFNLYVLILFFPMVIKLLGHECLLSGLALFNGNYWIVSLVRRAVKISRDERASWTKLKNLC